MNEPYDKEPDPELGPFIETPPLWFERAIATPAESRYVTVEGTQVHYLHWGDPKKPGLLLVHGNGAHARWWSFIAPFLAREYSVAAIDSSGMGDSGWRDHYTLETFAKEQIAVCEDAGFFKNEEPPIIVGHSFGGFVTIVTGSLYGDRLAGTIIVDSPVNPPDRKSGPPDRAFRPHRIYPSMDVALERFRLAPPQPCANRYIMEFIARHSLKEVPNPEGGQGWTWKFDPAIWQRFDIGDMSARLAATRCRIAIMRGEFSALLPPEIGDYMFTLLGRSAPVIEIPLAHHHVMLDQPLAFIAALRALLADWDHSKPTRRVDLIAKAPFKV